MPRDVRAYLADIVESCDAIAVALTGVDVEVYRTDRLIRSSVEGSSPSSAKPFWCCPEVLRRCSDG
jgi:hypothetical protein